MSALQQPEGVLLVRRALPQPGAVREEKLPVSDLQPLLDLCAQHARGAAFVQVLVTGGSGGERHRPVMDFGHFGRAE
jgi:hypothetical protein